MLEVQFGVGGDDSKIFVSELFSAYLKYARSLNLKAELLHSSDGHMMAKITGKDAGKAFKNESGKHCVQRIPPTEPKGRRQTSIISVAILPMKQDVGDIQLKESDLKIEPVNLGGKGGQHQNKTLSGCRMTHLPTGLKVVINGRDYHANLREARKILTARVNEKIRMERDLQYARERKSQLGDGNRSDKVRTYNFLEGRIVDHRLGKKTTDIKSVMKGDFGVLFK